MKTIHTAETFDGWFVELRVYFVQRGMEIVILLAGGDKSTQDKDIKTALNLVRHKGMTQLAKDTGLGRESLYKALSSEGNPSFGTILKVMRALGIKLHLEAASHS